MHSGKLWSPEGHGFVPNDSSWWGLLVRQARGFKTMYDRETLFRNLAIRAGDGVTMPDAASTAGASGIAATSPTGVAGRAAKPTGPNLLLEHFRKYTNEKAPVSLGKPVISFAIKNVASVSPYEMKKTGSKS
jgi:hypothetical protein